MSPLIVKYIHVKVKLFEKHILAPNFSNYDMRLLFGEDKIDVQVEGYVYAKQLNEVNQTIALNPQITLAPELINQVLTQRPILPTSTLDWRVLVNNYELEEIRAKHIVDLAQQYQPGETLFPLSLLDIWTPTGLTGTVEEQMLRARILELSQECDNYEDVVDAVIAISRKLIDEGLLEELICESVDRNILVDMNRRLVQQYPLLNSSVIHSLMWYHTLLLKTGGSNQWTLKRHFRELAVESYHPLILEALKQRVYCRVVVTPGHLQPDLSVSSGQSGGEKFAWKSVSIMKFLHGLTQAHYKDPTSQSTVPVIAFQERERTFKDATEEDAETEEVFFNRKNEGFMIVNGDLRKLYAMRPEALREMTFAQFVINYYRLQVHQKSLLQPQSDIGLESSEPVIGGNTRVPLFLKLANNIIMKKRSDTSRPVPLLLFSNGFDSYQARILFKPWRNLEEVATEGSEEESAQLRQNQLSLFPMSVFQRSLE